MQSLRCLLAMMALVEVSVAADGGRLAVRSEESPVAIRRLPPIDRDTSRRLRRAEQPVNHSRFALGVRGRGEGAKGRRGAGSGWAASRPGY